MLFELRYEHFNVIQYESPVLVIKEYLNDCLIDLDKLGLSHCQSYNILDMSLTSVDSINFSLLLPRYKFSVYKCWFFIILNNLINLTVFKF